MGLSVPLGFWAWWPVAGFPKIEQKPRLMRVLMATALSVLSSATDIVLRGLVDRQQMTFVMDAKRARSSPRGRIRLDAEMFRLPPVG
jgi:hypothetical protein